MCTVKVVKGITDQTLEEKHLFTIIFRGEGNKTNITIVVYRCDIENILPQLTASIRMIK